MDAYLKINTIPAVMKQQLARPGQGSFMMTSTLDFSAARLTFIFSAMILTTTHHTCP